MVLLSHRFLWNGPRFHSNRYICILQRRLCTSSWS